MFSKDMPMQISERTKMLFRKSIGRDEYMVFRCDTDEEIDICGNVTKLKGVRAYCTGCEREMWFDRTSREVASGYGCCHSKQQGFIDDYGEAHWPDEEFTCPYCDEAVTLKHVSQISDHTVTRGAFVQDIVRVGDEAAVVQWLATRWLDKSGRNGYDYAPIEAYTVEEYVTAKKKLKHTRLVKFAASVTSITSYTGVSMRTYWDRTPAARMTMRNADLIIEPEPGITDGTPLEKTGVEEYMRRAGYYADRLLGTWAKHPNVENLARQAPWLLQSMLAKCCHTTGYYYAARLVGEVLTEGVRWHKVKPHEMLGLDKDEMRHLEQERMGASKLSIYLRVREQTGERLSDEALDMNLYAVNGECKQLVDIRYAESIMARRISVEKAIRYLNTQSGRYGDAHPTASILIDTWDMLELRTGRLTPDVMWPRNLYETHDREVRLKKDMKVEQLNDRIHERFVALSEYSWEDVGLGLCIRPAASGTELHDEGCALHHCVETYAGKVATGKTAIFFIRKRSKRSKSFFTLELDEETLEVRQNRGLRNCARTPEVEEFEVKWLDYIRRKRGNENAG